MSEGEPATAIDVAAASTAALPEADASGVAVSTPAITVGVVAGSPSRKLFNAKSISTNTAASASTAMARAVMRLDRAPPAAAAAGAALPGMRAITTE
ncbi:MAG: hypothetical protein KDI55_23240, partial [Anaerolineae bacterium]|nr:hypothetical protein [Anaerolineae bacterium]